METKLNELKTRLLEVNDLNSANALLEWDQSTYMPTGGGAARARQSATLSRLAHEKLTDPAVGRLLDDLRPYEESLPYDSDDAALIRVTRREFERAVKVPSAFVSELSGHLAATYQVWTEARPADDFARVQPLLEKTLDLSRQLAGYFAPYEHIADPLIDMADYGMKVATLRPLFGQLRGQLVPIVEAITAQPPADDACLRQHFPERAQWDFAVDVIKRFGYDFDRGRQDKTHHPFMTKFSLGDVRITTRVAEDFLGENLFSTMHESGHAMYEQGIRMAYEGTPLAGGTSAGVHESQSRLWENVVGRSRAFWQHFYPELQSGFPGATGRGAARHVLSRHQQGAAVAHPHRRRRGHLQPARHDPVRLRAGAAGRHAGGAPICPRRGGRATRPIWASPRRTTKTACCRMSIGTAASSAARSRATRWATSSARSSTRPR